MTADVPAPGERASLLLLARAVDIKRFARIRQAASWLVGISPAVTTALAIEGRPRREYW